MDENQNKHLELLAPERIIDLANQGFVLDLEAPMMVITRDLGGTITTEITKEQHEALRRVRDMEAGLLHQYWVGDEWKAGDRLNYQSPLVLPEQPNANGKYAVVLHLNRVIH
ncbi:hypothetical protein [Deinococcus roseus]|uniref:Uncharacterized protein n=1 Tax=Deinococcus roseus TaxID=392414 RepID=A0ABQ2CWK9_9DEIO|nr:hypothetical protein [Deinococcus roseus]GGJ26669.1 hypothetical protein GCM10008938_11030 [Deinococcus roseus]